MHTEWMESDGHRSVLLHPGHTAAAAGVVADQAVVGLVPRDDRDDHAGMLAELGAHADTVERVAVADGEAAISRDYARQLADRLGR